MEKFLRKRKIWHLSYTLLTSDVEVDLSDFTIALSRKDKICLKTGKKKHVNQTSKMSYCMEAVTVWNAWWLQLTVWIIQSKYVDFYQVEVDRESLGSILTILVPNINS